MPVFAVHGHKIFGLGEAVNQLELALAGVALYMHFIKRFIYNYYPFAEEVVDYS